MRVMRAAKARKTKARGEAMLPAPLVLPGAVVVPVLLALELVLEPVLEEDPGEIS